MKKSFIYILIIILLLPALCACAGEDPYVPTTRQTVTAPEPGTSYETLAPIEQTTGTEAQSTAEPKDTADETSQAAQTTAAETEPPAPSDNKASFLFCGDNLAHDAVLNNAKRFAEGKDQTYDFLPIYSDVEPYIKKADCAVINQESQIAGDAGKIGGYPRFNTPKQMGEDLITLGFDVVTLANNHMLDNGTDGYKNCINYWKTKPVLSVGAYESKADYDNIRVLDVNGIKVAFLSYTEMINSGRKAEDGYITPLLDEATVKRHVEAAKKVSDVIIAVPHWGKEGSFGVTSTQKQYAALFAKCGVDVVVGMHSHVPGKIEYIDGTDGKKMLCVYSLGNFVSTMEYAADMVGYMLSFDIVKENGGFAVRNVVIIPTVTYFVYTASMKYEDRTDLHLYLLSDFTDELAAKHAYNEHEDAKIRLKELKKFITDNVDKEFLPDYLK